MPGKGYSKKNKEEARERARLEDRKKLLLSERSKKWYMFGLGGALLAFFSWIIVYMSYRNSESAMGDLLSFIFSVFSIGFSIIAAFEAFPEKSELLVEVRIEALSILLGAVLGFVVVLSSRRNQGDLIAALAADFSAIAFLMIFVQNGISYAYHLYFNNRLKKEIEKMEAGGEAADGGI